MLDEKKPLIIWEDENKRLITTYSEYKIEDGLITFFTNNNKISIPLRKVIKIKEDVNNE